MYENASTNNNSRGNLTVAGAVMRAGVAGCFGDTSGI